MDRNWDGNMVSVFWIRTWYGRKDDQESQDTADAGYKRLQYAALHIGNEEEPDEVLQEELFFDNKEEFGFDAEGTPKGDENVDFVNGVARGTPGSVPSYLITALMHYPNSFDGISERYWWNHSPEEIEAETPFMNMSQNMLILVADREACEEGWVLHLSVNHKGEVLPFRVRDRASCVYQSVANWMEGQPLNENAFCDMNVEYYQSDGDGWNPDYVLC